MVLFDNFQKQISLGALRVGILQCLTVYFIYSPPKEVSAMNLTLKATYVKEI